MLYQSLLMNRILHRIAFLVFCLFIGATITHAQDLGITDLSNQNDISGATITLQSTDNNGWVGFESLDLAIQVNNLSSSTMEIGVRKIEHDTLQPDVQHTICFAGACYATNVFVSPNHVFLSPGASDSGFIAHYLFDNRVHIRGVNHVEYLFYDVNNPNVSVSVNVVYNTVVSTGIDEQSKLNLIGQLFPNPADKFISLEFGNSISDFSGYQFQIANAYGSIADVNKTSTNGGAVSFTTTDLPAGIYFLSVKKNGTVIKCTKFILSH